MTKQYVAKNGKVFETEEQCLAYEAELEAEEQKKAKLKEEKDARTKEIEDMFYDLINKVEAYQKDYKDPVTFSAARWEDLNLISNFMRRMFL